MESKLLRKWISILPFLIARTKYLPPVYCCFHTLYAWMTTVNHMESYPSLLWPLCICRCRLVEMNICSRATPRSYFICAQKWCFADLVNPSLTYELYELGTQSCRTFRLLCVSSPQALINNQLKQRISDILRSNLGWTQTRCRLFRSVDFVGISTLQLHHQASTLHFCARRMINLCDERHALACALTLRQAL